MSNKRNAIRLRQDEILALVRAALHSRGIRTAPSDLVWAEGEIYVHSRVDGDDVVANILLQATEHGSAPFWGTIGRCAIDVETAERVIDQHPVLIITDRDREHPMIKRKKDKR